MKNTSYLTILLLLTYTQLFSQLNFHCEELNVYNIVHIEDTSNLIEEEHGGGPYLDFTCELKNISDTSICLTSNYSKVDITFYYQGKLYKDKPIIDGIDKEEVFLNPSQSIVLHFGSDIFFFTDVFYEPYKKDYTKNLIEILPTLSVEYSDKEIAVVKCVIRNVKAHF